MDMKASTGINISSVILGVLPADAEQVCRELQALAGVEVHAVAEDGRMIVSIESASEGATVDTFEAIRQYESDPDEEA
jgi:nitrate reductase NapD